MLSLRSLHEGHAGAAIGGGGKGRGVGKRIEDYRQTRQRRATVLGGGAAVSIRGSPALLFYFAFFLRVPLFLDGRQNFSTIVSCLHRLHYRCCGRIPYCN